MESSPFLYYNPSNSKQPSRQHGQFVSHPPSTMSQQHKTVSNNSASLSFPSALYSSRSSTHQHHTTIHASTPMLAAMPLTPEALQKSTGLLTPPSPNLLGMDGPNAGDLYFYSHAHSHESPENNITMSTHITPPNSRTWSVDESCAGGIKIELPTTPQAWKDRSHITISTQGMN
jgi:hypothetical protein